MRNVRRSMELFSVLTLCVAAAIAALPALSRGQSHPPVIQDKADQLLRQMSDYLAGLKQFQVETENTVEVLLKTGEKIQFENPAKLSLQRPDKFRAERKGDSVNQEFYYDGKTLSLYLNDKNFYATVPAPATIDKTIDYAREALNLYAPGGDLIYTNTYAILTEDAISGSYIGMSVIGGTRCHHLAFRGNEVDWQIWIEDGDRPLPKKFVVTSKWMTGAPQFTVVIRLWDLSPWFAEGMFTFTPPGDARQIDFIRPAVSGAVIP